jgi:hypothetical protein
LKNTTINNINKKEQQQLTKIMSQKKVVKRRKTTGLLRRGRSIERSDMERFGGIKS